MHLKKGIGFWGVFSIASGAMISSGIFILPGLAYAQVGPAVFLSYGIAGILGFLGILSVVELTTAMPKAGGDYYFIHKTFGPMLGFVSGSLGWLALSLKSAFAIFGLAEILFLSTGVSPLISGFFLCLLFVLINIRGAKEAAVFQILLVAGLFALMILYIAVGLTEVDSARFTPFLKSDVNTVIVTAGFIFISFGGLLKVANVSEEVKDPKKNIPRGIIASILAVTLFYTLITFVITGTLPAEVFERSLTPVADSARILMGPVGYGLIIVGSLLAFITTANAGIMAASRYPIALSRDKLLPRGIGTLGKRYGTPVYAILLTGGVIYLALLLPLEVLVKSASTVILTSYVLTNISVIIFRESKITNYRPSFKTPFYPFLQILCVVLFTFFIIDLGMDAIEISLGFLFFSFCVYIFYGRKGSRRESALLHLLKNIADQGLAENILEDELREVLISRDNIEQDHFDELIKGAEILDLKGPLSFPKLLDRVAGDIAREVGMEEQEILSRFLKRQEDTNTAVSDFLAIPHIIIEGEQKQFLKIVRCREGVGFTREEDRVNAVFLFGGTKSQRVLHLKTIAAIATLVGHEDFQQQWMSLESPGDLKNLMILSSRKRF